jgi:elongation factor 2 kinase
MDYKRLEVSPRIDEEDAKDEPEREQKRPQPKERPPPKHFAHTVAPKAGRGGQKFGGDVVWIKLQELKVRLDKGQLSKEEYESQRQILVDELTGTKKRPANKKQATRKPQLEAPAPVVVNRGPPDFSQIPSEPALLHMFDLERNKWSSIEVTVKIEKTAFAKGTLRTAHHMSGMGFTHLADSKTESGSKVLREMQEDLQRQKVAGQPDLTAPQYVAKISLDPNEDRDIYFQDVCMQCVAKMYTKMYNSYNPPKKVDFINSWLLELTARPDKPLCGVERYITGEYRKHNNNFGYVSEDERNTPQAFSHFTYEASNQQLLICDIQGVSDLYTDPQIHSIDGEGFGKGNMGDKGFEKFLSTHRCNAVCRYLKLPAINAKQEMEDIGTLPAEPYMRHTRVQAVLPDFSGGGAEPESFDENNFSLPAVVAKEKSGCCCVLL